MTTNQSGYRISDFGRSLCRHMQAWPGFTASHPFKWADWTEGIHQDYRILAKRAVRADSVRCTNTQTISSVLRCLPSTSSCPSGKARGRACHDAYAT